MSAGTMVVLSDSIGDIDTSDQLEMFEGFQKVFIVNGTNLKIADFINTKLTVTALTTAPTRGSIVTQAGSGATMLVDFVNAAKTIIYGYTTSDDPFVTSGALSGGSMDPEDKVPSAVAQATTTPHWYDWTVYPDSASGSLPDQAYLGCLWRGRMILSGNPDSPHQWYMSRQADHTDFAYTASDAQSPVAGGNADAGEIGDIVRCLIPYSDDYLIFGCATSIWVLRGDPAAGGSLDDLDKTVGIYGARSWCLDKKGNLYFWGTGGLYKMERDMGKITNISEISLPELVGDEAADPTTHRITLAYDRKRFGVIVCVTKLSDGTNSNYWISLGTKATGLFPESYPEECGVYSLFYYDANDKDYRDLLVGCRDGYIRKFDTAAKDDDIGVIDEAISSYVLYPILQMGEDDVEGILTSLTIELAGGASGGAHADTDGVSYDIYSADDAETLIEDIKDGATAKVTAALSGTGRKTRIRPRVRGAYVGIKFSNSTASETFAINRVLVDVREAGRVR
ncbi:hypothetical protein LCGC14_0960250 [marine sediment metagenome]|uniref:Uncharacterized protein n=1 Tax=marine sediment metagenome TaxID=412755 RepID=A0A0F9NJF7_9ZZZZ